jgi:hypothetical protein
MDHTNQVMELYAGFTLGKRFRRAYWCTAAIALLGAVLNLSCGGTTPAQVVTVSVSPATAQVALRGQLQFTASVSGGSAGVSWSVDGAAGGNIVVGAIDNSGLYTAPGTLPAPNTVTVTATSLAAPAQSASATVTLVNPAPAVSTISPSTVNAGSANTTLTVTGTGFTAQSAVEIGGTGLATLYVNPTVLTATVTAAQLANAGNLPVAVATPAPGGGTSSTLTLTVLAVAAVNPPAPTVLAGQAEQFTANVTGSSNQAEWSVNGVAGGSAALGTIDNAGLYTAPPVPPVPNVVTVEAASASGPAWSATASVTVVNPAPAISSLTPAVVFALSGATELTVTGTGFTPQSTLAVNGSAFPATLVSSAQLTANWTALMVAQPAAFNLVVSNPGPGGGTSSAATFTVVAQGSVTPTNNPQVALYSFSSPRDASVSIEFGTDTTYGKSTWVQNTPPGGGAVQILVAGMLANTTYHMRADVTFSDGTQFTDSDHTFATGGLPAAQVPQITVTNPNGLTPTPGAILLQLNPGLGGTPTSQVYLAAVDNAGNLIWYYSYDTSIGYPIPAKLLPNGHMLINFCGATPQMVTYGGTVQEIDLAGNLIYQFDLNDLTNWLNAAGYTTLTPVASIHHDILPLPNGHLIVVFNHDVQCTAIPGCVGTQDVIADALVDLDQNHNIVWVWDSLAHTCPPNPTSPCLNINRHPVLLSDWLHANDLIYSPDDGNLILGIVAQAWIIKIDYQDGQGSGDVLWRLGPEGDFTLTNGGLDAWFMANHDPNIVSPNSTGVFNLILFNNDDYNGLFNVPPTPCSTPGNPVCQSTVPIYQVDEENMTATILWQYPIMTANGASTDYSWYTGSARLLDDNRVDMGINVPTDDPTGSRYMEVTYPDQQIVLRMEVSGQQAYRMIHYPSLYPGVQW